ncbi:MAG: fumarate hydratase [Deltaproteobacteria bacterium]|nr:fumarate hydratase [Deltaproteobacteria bacterium]
MTTIRPEDIREAARACLVRAGSRFRPDQEAAYEAALARESNPRARWVLEGVLANARLAARNQSPLCDDTGIPHLFVGLGQEAALPPDWLSLVHQGVAQGLTDLPGRPMAVLGDDIARIEQAQGLSPDPADMLPAPAIVEPRPGPELELAVLLLGGGPEIRARTLRVFHKRSADHVLAEAAAWAAKEAASLGCTPLVAALGIGRSHQEAAALMLRAMARGRFDRQSPWEQKVTAAINQTQVGPLGLGGSNTCLATFLQIGPQRASGVRIVCLRPGCCFEPRRATVRLGPEGWRFSEPA